MLSIIIPTYNEETLLPLLLNSIKAQSFKDYEIIVADNQSTDKTTQIAEEHNCVIVEGGLPGKGRNCGAMVANGDTLLFLDADVILPPTFIEDILAEYKNKEYGVATCRIDPISNRWIDFFLHWCYNTFIVLAVMFCPYAPGFCIIADKKIHKALMGFDEAIMLGEDSDYVQRAGKISKFGILKSHKVPVSVRRFDRDGRFNISVKYILSGLYMFFVGNIKSDIFKYTFGYKKKD